MTRWRLAAAEEAIWRWEGRRGRGRQQQRKGYGDGKDEAVEVGSISGGDMAMGRTTQLRSAAAAEATASAAGGGGEHKFYK